MGDHSRYEQGKQDLLCLPQHVSLSWPLMRFAVEVLRLAGGGTGIGAAKGLCCIFTATFGSAFEGYAQTAQLRPWPSNPKPSTEVNTALHATLGGSGGT